MKKKIGVTIIWLVILLFYGLLLELSKNTLWGWGIFLAVMVAFLILQLKVLAEKRWWVKCLTFLALVPVLYLIYRVSYPPYERVPAVQEKNPKPTEVITVAEGALTGIYNGEESVEVFTGIPYAKPPVGDLRWKEPQAPEPWEGVRVCDHFAPKFMQSENTSLWDSLVSLVIYDDFDWFNPRDNYREAMSEDALYVNVWKPAGDVSDCPVIFYVHGGSLQSGSPSFDQYNGESFAKRGIVFVDFGYRLNVFGYFADEALQQESPNHTTGNYGLLDQIAALSWVHENIASFGGDPDNITIAGESAGSSSVNALCVSPLTEGLFRRAVAESSAININRPYHTFRPFEDALEMKDTVYEAMGVSTLQELREIDAKTLVQAAGEYNSMTVDGYGIAEQPALTYLKGENHEEALLNGYNGTEADVFTILGTKVTEENYRDWIEKQLGEEITDEVIALYPPGTDPKAQYNAVMSASWFAYSHYTWSRLMAAEGRPVYEYWFTKTNRGLSCNHAGELPYFYGNLETMPRAYQSSDYALSNIIMDYIENFARTGDPNGEDLPVWPDFSGDETKLLEFGEVVGLSTDQNLDLYRILDRDQGFSLPE